MSAYAFGLQNITGSFLPDGCIDRSGSSHFGSFSDHIEDATQAVQKYFPDFLTQVVDSCSGIVSQTLKCEMGSEEGSSLEEFHIYTWKSMSAASSLFIDKFDDEKCLLDSTTRMVLLVITYIFVGIAGCCLLGYVGGKVRQCRDRPTDIEGRRPLLSINNQSPQPQMAAEGRSDGITALEIVPVQSLERVKGKMNEECPVTI